MTDDIDSQDEMALAAEYALGLLSDAEVAAIEDVMAVDPALRDEYAMWAENFASLTDDVAPVAPPAALEARIQEALFGPPEAPLAKKKSWIARLGLLGPVMAGVAAAIVVLFALNQMGFLRDDGPQYVAQVVSEDASFAVVAQFDPDANTLTMERQAGGPTAGRSQEVWLIAGGNPPVSLGTWPMGVPKPTLAISPEIAAQIEGGVLAISDEPLGGSPTGAPTGEILGAGQVTLLL